MPDINNRYSRQIALPEIREDGQERLAQTSVLCVGAGGLGSPALLYLAAAGVGTIGVIDFDTVEESNLQRQVLFSSAETGQPKASLAQEKLQALNPHISVHVYKEALSVQNAPDLFQKYDIILDGTDNFAAKFLINDAAVKYQKPWVYGAIQGFDGQVSLFNAAKGACYRCLYPAPPKARIANCAEAGVIGAVAGIVGVTQALQVIEWTVAHDSFSPLVGKLWVVDSKTMQTRILNISKNNDCPVCSQKSEDIMLPEIMQTCAVVPEIEPDEVRNDPDCFLIDVREDDEWQAGHIEGALHWPLSRILNNDLPKLPEGKKIVFFCRTGPRSQMAVRLFMEKGHTRLYNLTGGYSVWAGMS